MSISNEDNIEHDHKTNHVVCASTEGGAQLWHGLVEADILEDFDPACESGDGDGVVEHLLVAGEGVELWEDGLVCQQAVNDCADFDDSVNVEDHADIADDKDHYVQDIPDFFKVLEFVDFDLGKDKWSAEIQHDF